MKKYYANFVETSLLRNTVVLHGQFNSLLNKQISVSLSNLLRGGKWHSENHYPDSDSVIPSSFISEEAQK